MELRAFQIRTQHAHPHLCVNPPSNIQSPTQALRAQMLSIKEVETKKKFLIHILKSPVIFINEFHPFLHSVPGPLLGMASAQLYLRTQIGMNYNSHYNKL